MVHKKITNYGRFNGLRTPVVPKAPRSLRRSPQRKSSECGEISAFDLLATVAGKLLQESESSISSTGPEGTEQIRIPNEVKVKVKPVRFEYLDQGSYIESDFIHEPTNPKLKVEPPLKNLPESDNQTLEVRKNVEFEASEGENGVNDTPSEPEGGLSRFGDLCDVNSGNDRSEPRLEAVEKQIRDLTGVKSCSFKDPNESCVNPHVLNKSSSNVHLPFYNDPVSSDVKIGIRDDDENFRSNYHSSKMRAFRSKSSAGCRRIRKMLTSRCWKVAPKLKDYELSNGASDGDKPVHLNKENIYIRKRCQGDAASKRRRLFHSSKTSYVEESRNGSMSNLPEKSSSGNKKHPSAAFNKVKLSIKSIKVPEVYVEVPETATVASLKRTVMEAVTAILEGELHVGLLLQGKKVRDDHITLRQTGISQNNLEAVQFTLEPSYPQASQYLVHKEPPLLLQYDTHQQLSRTAAMDVGYLNSVVDPPCATNLDSQVEKKQERVANFKALVPLNNKSTKRSELLQRRTRRPFSVSEVEALVEAVETLGTGRWRDVKMRAFDDANHRTYVDLKDKWKTLVHTASISRQQRRGEAVPQDLLDRVLAAHAYWSHRHTQPLQTLPTPIKVF